jgi:hypothetical protein
MTALAALMAQNSALTLALLGALLLVTTAFSGLWLNQALREGVSWLRVSVLVRPRRSVTPELYWLGVAGQAALTLCLGLGGFGLLVWSVLRAAAG